MCGREKSTGISTNFKENVKAKTRKTNYFNFRKLLVKIDKKSLEMPIKVDKTNKKC